MNDVELALSEELTRDQLIAKLKELKWLSEEDINIEMRSSDPIVN